MQVAGCYRGMPLNHAQRPPPCMPCMQGSDATTGSSLDSVARPSPSSTRRQVHRTHGASVFSGSCMAGQKGGREGGNAQHACGKLTAACNRDAATWVACALEAPVLAAADGEAAAVMRPHAWVLHGCVLRGCLLQSQPVFPTPLCQQTTQLAIMDSATMPTELLHFVSFDGHVAPPRLSTFPAPAILLFGCWSSQFLSTLDPSTHRLRPPRRLC